MTPTFWTDERVEILKGRRAEHWSGRAIAELLGCTRDAVLGKANRLGLPVVVDPVGRPVGGRALASVRGESRTLHVRSAPLPPDQRLADLPAAKDEPPSRRIAFADLKSGECGWIAGDDGCCCGHATTQILARGRRMASPYCGFHSARAYRVPQKQSA